MEKEKVLEALHKMKEAYEDEICDFANAIYGGEEQLRDGDNACYARELVSGMKSTLIDIGMMEGGDGGSYAAYDDEAMRSRGSMRMMRGSRDEGSERRSRTTGRYMRAMDKEPGDMRQYMQERINRLPDPQTRMDMQRMFDKLQDVM